MGNARKTVLRLLTRLENSGSYSNILLDEGLELSLIHISEPTRH